VAGENTQKKNVEERVLGSDALASPLIILQPYLFTVQMVY
jgi:hypothetical protein